MSDRPTLLAVFAHPDDESIAAGGTLARYAEAGVRTALLCATRGEWGPISDESLADYDNLGEVREHELRQACEVLGVSWLRFLDLPDGGVSWAINEDESGVLEKIVRAVRELRPQVIITFGPDGMYGHEDHIAVCHLTTKAFSFSHRTEIFSAHFEEGLLPIRPAKLYYSAFPQGLMNNLIARMSQAGLSSGLWEISPDRFGIPAQAITARIDVIPFVERKLAALRCHRTQLDDHHVFSQITPELAEEIWGIEHFRRHTEDSQSPEHEIDLFSGLSMGSSYTRRSG